MKRKRHNHEQIIRKLRSAEQLLNQGQAVADVCRALDVSAPTYYRWQQLYGGMKATEAKRQRSLSWRTPALSASLLTQNSLRRCLRSLPRETSEPGASSQGRSGSA